MALDLHPEELLDRERDGALAPVDRARLDEHLAACEACAFERRAKADFARDRQALPDEDELARRIASAAAASLGVGEPLDGNPSGAGPDHQAASTTLEPPRVRRRPGFWIRAAIAAAAVLSAGAAAAAIWLGTHRPPPAPSPPEPVSEEGVPPELPPTAVPPAPPEASAAAVDESAPSSSSSHPSTQPSGARSDETAESLFTRANQARRRGSDAEAIRLYRELQRRFPGSREANLSKATLGQLLLDRGDAEGARAQYDAYLDKGSNGQVTEEALVGRALALGKQGKTADERAAWQELLAKYPQSVHATRARKRLAELP